MQLPRCGVFVLESHHARGFQMEPVRHDFLKLLLPFSGRGWLVRPGRRVPLAPHDLVLVPAETVHHLEDDGPQPLALYALCVAAKPFAEAHQTFGTFRRFAAPIWGAEIRALIRHLLHEQTLGRAGGELTITGLAWQILGVIARAASQSALPAANIPRQLAHARVAAYAAEMSGAFYRRQTIDDAAAGLGLSRRHFTQLFREVTGTSWLNALQRHRLEHARRLLRETDRSVTSICYECGFEDLTTFYRTFKAVEKTSPVAWRSAAIARAQPANPRPGNRSPRARAK